MNLKNVCIFIVIGPYALSKMGKLGRTVQEQESCCLLTYLGLPFVQRRHLQLVSNLLIA